MVGQGQAGDMRKYHMRGMGDRAGYYSPASAGPRVRTGSSGHAMAVDIPVADEARNDRGLGYNSSATANWGLDRMQTQREAENGEFHHSPIRRATTDSPMMHIARNLPTNEVGKREFLEQGRKAIVRWKPAIRPRSCSSRRLGRVAGHSCHARGISAPFG